MPDLAALVGQLFPYLGRDPLPKEGLVRGQLLLGRVVLHALQEDARLRARDDVVVEGLDGVSEREREQEEERGDEPDRHRPPEKPLLHRITLEADIALPYKLATHRIVYARSSDYLPAVL